MNTETNKPILFNYSEWQEMDNPPTLEGVYEIDTKENIAKYAGELSIHWYSYWNGKYFCTISTTIYDSDKDKEIRSNLVYQQYKLSSLMWRGIV